MLLIGPDMAACSHLQHLHIGRHASTETCPSDGAGASRGRKRRRTAQQAHPAPQQHMSQACQCVQLCQQCSLSQRALRIGLCTERFEDAVQVLPRADLTMLFHPGLAAEQPQVVETACLWQHKQSASKQHAPPANLSPNIGHQHGRHLRTPQKHTQSSMRSLAKAWRPALRRLQACRAPVFCTAFSFTEAADEVAVLCKITRSGQHKLVAAHANPFASLTPRAMPVPARAGAMCRGESPLWQELASEQPDVGRVLQLENDWLHVNKVIFGMLPRHSDS